MFTFAPCYGMPLTCVVLREDFPDIDPKLIQNFVVLYIFHQTKQNYIISISDMTPRG